VQALKRLFVFAVISIISAIPAMTIKVTHVGSPIIIMFTNIIIPGIVASMALIAGPYDKIIDKI
jgi:hypothetical protein